MWAAGSAAMSDNRSADLKAAMWVDEWAYVLAGTMAAWMVGLLAALWVALKAATTVVWWAYAWAAS
jgi:hypothetical protein